MKCPNCGCDIEEGKLLCESCGAEINIVPEFDMELDQQIDETLGNIAKSFIDQITDEQDVSESNPEQNQEDSDVRLIRKIYFFFKSHRIFSGVFCVSIILAILICIVINMFQARQYHSYDYQYEQAVQYHAMGELDEAIASLDRALAIEPDHFDARILLASFTEASGNVKSAKLMLREIIQNDSPYQHEAYDLLLQILEREEAYTELGNLLNKCNDEALVQKYAKYYACVPSCNIQEGLYDKVQTVVLSCSGEGFIYYTLDGTTPTHNSTVYDHPITLETGDYTIKALFVNMYGVDSEILSKTFYIDVSAPRNPEINLESGDYIAPQMIEIYHDTKTKIYYTIDGSIPDKSSLRYTEPLEMLYGTSNLNVVAINEQGVSSEIVRRTFHCSVKGNFDPDLAIQVLMNNLLVSHIILDMEGTVPDKLGKNSYAVQTVVDISDRTFYIVCEKYTDTTGKVHDTNNLYAIAVDTAEIYNARKIGEGNYYLSKFE